MSIEQMTHFPRYYVNEKGWLFTKCAKTGKFFAKPTQMKFPYGKYPYYVIQKDGKKYFLLVDGLNKDSTGEPYKSNNRNEHTVGEKND